VVLATPSPIQQTNQRSNRLRGVDNLSIEKNDRTRSGGKKRRDPNGAGDTSTVDASAGTKLRNNKSRTISNIVGGTPKVLRTDVTPHGASSPLPSPVKMKKKCPQSSTPFDNKEKTESKGKEKEEKSETTSPARDPASRQAGSRHLRSLVWTCGACTFAENPATKKKCIVCLSERGKDYADAELVKAQKEAVAKAAGCSR